MLSLLVYILLAYATLIDGNALPYSLRAVPVHNVTAVTGRGIGGPPPPQNVNPIVPKPKPDTPKPDPLPETNIDLNHPDTHTDLDHPDAETDPRPGGKPRNTLHDLPDTGRLDTFREGKFNIGSYNKKSDDERTLFNNFQGPDQAFFNEIRGILGATEDYYTPSDDTVYKDLEPDQRPFDTEDPPKIGQDMELRANMRFEDSSENPKIEFKPSDPLSACDTWLGLYNYCYEDGDRNAPDIVMECACYSSTYYVPDQFTKLASRCANAPMSCDARARPSEGRSLDRCDVRTTAASYTTYCTPRKGEKAVKFAGVINVHDFTPKAVVSLTSVEKSTSSHRKTPTRTTTHASAKQTTPQTSTTQTSTSSTSSSITPTPILIFSHTTTTAAPSSQSNGLCSLVPHHLLASISSWVIMVISIVVYV